MFTDFIAFTCFCNQQPFFNGGQGVITPFVRTFLTNKLEKNKKKWSNIRILIPLRYHVNIWNMRDIHTQRRRKQKLSYIDHEEKQIHIYKETNQES